MPENKFIHNIAVFLTLIAFINVNSLNTCGMDINAAGEFDLLSAYTTFGPKTPSEGPMNFQGSLLSNKHFILTVVSIADYLSVRPYDREGLKKWSQHQFAGVCKEWVNILDLENIEIRGDSARIRFTLNDEEYSAEVTLKERNKRGSGSLNIKVTEGKKALVDEPLPSVYLRDKTRKIKVGFSVLSSGVDGIADEVREVIAAGVDSVHLDHLDGVFTPGLKPFSCLNQIRELRDMGVPMNVHLMVSEPEAGLIDQVIDAGLKPGRDNILIHCESFHNFENLKTMVGYIKSRGIGVGLAINPETQIRNLATPLRKLADDIDSLMIMSIIPGAGSRPFIEESMNKVRELRDLMGDLNPARKVDIIIDGGINENSIVKIIDSGADELITRTWLLSSSKGVSETVRQIKTLSVHRQESDLLKEMMEERGMEGYGHIKDALVTFCRGGNTFTKDELISALERMEGVERVAISDDRVVDIFYADKLVRFHDKKVIPIEHLGLKDRTYYDGIVVKVYAGNVTKPMKGRYILGISGSWHDSTAVLVRDGKIVAALEEERMTREKHDTSLFPVNAIRRLLEDEKITWDDVGHIAFGWNFNNYVDTQHSENPNDVFFRDMDERYAASKGIPAGEVVRRKSSERNKDRFDVARVYSFLYEMSGTYGTDHEPRVSFVGHSQSHAASAYYLSGFDGDVLTVALDGYGDTESGSVWACKNGAMKEISRFTLPHSLGWMYIAVTEYLGFKPNSGEGEVMGFAPYGEPWDSVEMERVNKLEEIFRDYMRFDRETGTLVSNPEYYYYGEMVDGKNRITRTFQDKLAELGIRPNERSSSKLDPLDPTDRPYANLAYVLQKRTEEVVSSIVRFYLKDNPETNNIDKLALAGGITLNILANGRLISDGLVFGENIFVQPAAGDSGTAIGAALSVAHKFYGQDVMGEMDHAFYGPEYSDADIREALDAFGLVEGEDYEHLPTDRLLDKTAGYIEKAQAVAWFQGRSEVGPRALGARSILLNLNDVQANNTANIIKGRQPWRPSASSVLEEAAKDYFRGIGKSPFMVISFPILYGKQRTVLSGAHEFGDKLARPQTVSRTACPLYWQLLKKLGEKTGIPAVVNTSFNKQEPLVEHPEEALNTFYYMDKVDHLVIGNYVVSKTRNLSPRVISLSDEKLIRDMVAEAEASGDINKWIHLFSMINETLLPNCHKVEITLDRGVYGEKKILFPLMKDIFSGPLKDPVLRAMVSMINDYATEYNAKKIYIGSTFGKMENIVFQNIKAKLVSNFPRMRYFANSGNEVEILPLSTRGEKMSGLRESPVLVERLSFRERTGTFIGIDVGATRIKAVLIEDGNILRTKTVGTTFEGGRQLGKMIRELAKDIAGDNVAADGLGIALPGVVDPLTNRISWLVNYEPKWDRPGNGAAVSEEYQDLTDELLELEKEFGYGKVNLVNDGTAHGITSLNDDRADDAVVVAIGTGIGAARIEKGVVDISRIEQSGAFVTDVGKDADVDEACGVRGCFSANLRDGDGKLMPATKLAERMVRWFRLMHSMRGDKNFILTGGVMTGEYGDALIMEINRLLVSDGNKYGITVAVSNADREYSGAIGAAELSMKISLYRKMEILHQINMSLLVPQQGRTKVNHIITKELVPLAMRARFEGFLKELYGKYPFLKEREEIRLVSREDIAAEIARIKEDTTMDNTIDVALDNVDDISVLPEGVKALVFSDVADNTDFVQVEGIIAALRALDQKDIKHLIKVYELLTGSKFDLDEYPEERMLEIISSPEELARILLFRLNPPTGLTDALVLNNKLLRYIEESA